MNQDVDTRKALKGTWIHFYPSQSLKGGSRSEVSSENWMGTFEGKSLNIWVTWQHIKNPHENHGIPGLSVDFQP